MAGCGYTIFDTAVGRCGIAWGDAGIVGVQLPEVREIETRRRLFRLYPDARELPPPLSVETAIDGIAALLRGEGADLSGVTLDLGGIPAFNARVYTSTRRLLSIEGAGSPTSKTLFDVLLPVAPPRPQT